MQVTVPHTMVLTEVNVDLAVSDSGTLITNVPEIMPVEEGGTAPSFTFRFHVPSQNFSLAVISCGVVNIGLTRNWSVEVGPQAITGKNSMAPKTTRFFTQCPTNFSSIRKVTAIRVVCKELEKEIELISPHQFQSLLHGHNVCSAMRRNHGATNRNRGIYNRLVPA